MKQRFKYPLLILLIIILCTCSLKSLGQKIQSDLNSDSIAVVQSINEFIDAFSTLNWQKFTKCFADDATAFFPLQQISL
jgi:hypothetical protein